MLLNVGDPVRLKIPGHNDLNGETGVVVDIKGPMIFVQIGDSDGCIFPCKEGELIDPQICVDPPWPERGGGKIKRDSRPETRGNL